MNSEKENLWKILKGELTLPEMMRYFGRTEQQISEIMKELKEADNFDTRNHFVLAHYLVRRAYDKLCELGEIDGTKIFNLATKSFDGKNEFHDLGVCGDKNYIYGYSGWQELPIIDKH